MQTTCPTTFLSMLTLALTFASTAQQPPPPSDAPWRPLPLIQDGKVSPDWTHLGFGRFTPVDNALRTDCDERGMGLLVYTRQRLGDCQIRVVFRPQTPTSNSGVYVRIDDGLLAWKDKPLTAVRRQPGGKLSPEMLAKLQAAADAEEGVWYAVHHGYEVQINDAADPAHRTGAIYGLANAQSLPKREPDAWRTMIITLRGSQILVDIDGQRVSTFNSEDPNLPPRKSWTEPKRDAKRPHAGYLALQTHDPGDTVFFKEISTRPLPVDAAAKP